MGCWKLHQGWADTREGPSIGNSSGFGTEDGMTRVMKWVWIIIQVIIIIVNFLLIKLRRWQKFKCYPPTTSFYWELKKLKLRAVSYHVPPYRELPAGPLGLTNLWTLCWPFPIVLCTQQWENIMIKHLLRTLLCIILDAFTRKMKTPCPSLRQQRWRLALNPTGLLTPYLVLLPLHLSCRSKSPSMMVVEQDLKGFSFKGCQQCCICFWGKESEWRRRDPSSQKEL